MPSLPRNAAESQPWLDSTVDAVTACAIDAQLAYEYMLKVEDDDISFEDLGVIPPSMSGIEAKLRSAITKHTVGSEASKNPDLVSKLVAKREELKRKPRPVQISGRQLMWVVRRFFRVDDGSTKTTFELSTLMAISWPGDAKISYFKDRWDHIVRNLRSPISDRDLEELLVSKVRTSELLKVHLDYYDRLPRGHGDKCYAWVSQLIDTIVE